MDGFALQILIASVTVLYGVIAIWAAYKGSWALAIVYGNYAAANIGLMLMGTGH